MALARTLAVTLAGVRGRMVEIQADVAAGIPGLSFTGLADTSVVESRDRMRAAMGNSGVEWPQRKVTLALLPADERKVGSRFDLAMSMAVLAASTQVPADAVTDTCWLAELGLDGRLRPVRGVLPSLVAARRAGVRRAVVAADNAAEAALVRGLEVYTARDVAELVGWLRGEGDPPARAVVGRAMPDPDALRDLVDVAGQGAAKRALEIGAAGGHHLYLIGSPGAGKTMLAERLPSLLPALDDEAALEVTAIHSVAGRLDSRCGLIRRAPLQAPHHTASVAALVGGGANLARPGAISLAHHGVLLLDEAAEFSTRALEALRQPLESGRVVLSRSGGVIDYPARFQLVMTANPCPCGSRARECTCAPQARRRYQQRLSGPLLDRVDLRVEVEPVPHADLVGVADRRETSAAVAIRVRAARDAAAERWRATRWRVNADVPGAFLRAEPWSLSHAVTAPAEAFLERGQLSARGFDRVLRLAWTVADLAGRTSPDAGDVAEALYFRTGRAGGAWAA